MVAGLKREIDEKRTLLITYSQAMDRYNLGKNKIYNLAKEADALIKIGNCARIDMKKMDEFVLSFKG